MAVALSGSPWPAARRDPCVRRSARESDQQRRGEVATWRILRGVLGPCSVAYVLDAAYTLFTVRAKEPGRATQPTTVSAQCLLHPTTRRPCAAASRSPSHPSIAFSFVMSAFCSSPLSAVLASSSGNLTAPTSTDAREARKHHRHDQSDSGRAYRTSAASARRHTRQTVSVESRTRNPRRTWPRGGLSQFGTCRVARSVRETHTQPRAATYSRCDASDLSKYSCTPATTSSHTRISSRASFEAVDAPCSSLGKISARFASMKSLRIAVTVTAQGRETTLLCWVIRCDAERTGGRGGPKTREPTRVR